MRRGHRKYKRRDRFKEENGFTYAELIEYRLSRFQSVGLYPFILIDKKPDSFTTRQWNKHLSDKLEVKRLIDEDEIIPEKLKQRLLKATAKIKKYMRN